MRYVAWRPAIRFHPGSCMEPSVLSRARLRNCRSSATSRVFLQASKPRALVSVGGSRAHGPEITGVLAGLATPLAAAGPASSRSRRSTLTTCLCEATTWIGQLAFSAQPGTISQTSRELQSRRHQNERRQDVKYPEGESRWGIQREHPSKMRRGVWLVLVSAHSCWHGRVYGLAAGRGTA